eukprot:10745107-Prorocentrum_lima.AAC.1
MAPSMLVIRQGDCVVYVNDHTLAAEWLDRLLRTDRKGRTTPPPTADAVAQTQPPPKLQGGLTTTGTQTE